MASRKNRRYSRSKRLPQEHPGQAFCSQLHCKIDTIFKVINSAACGRVTMEVDRWIRCDKVGKVDRVHQIELRRERQCNILYMFHPHVLLPNGPIFHEMEDICRE